MDQIHLFTMKNPLSGSTYEKIYQDLKNISKNGEAFCKSLMSVLQQRSNLEMSYAKGLEKLANKLTKALDSMNKNCIHNAWTCASEEMRTTAEVHKKLGIVIQTEAIKPTNQVLEEHDKRKKKLDNEVEKMANSVLSNWRQQIKTKKKLMDHTKKHETLFHHVEAENSKQTLTEKERQKLFNKLKKSTEVLTKTDADYYQENIAGQAVRLKWENVLENCYASIQELEKERIQLLSHILTRYNQHVSNFGQTLNTSQNLIDQAIKSIDVEKDIQTFLEDTAVYSENNKSEFLLLDYYEEDGSSVMNGERRIASINTKLERLQHDIEKALKDKDGLEKMLKAYDENPAFSDIKNEENTADLLEETKLKISLLEANHFKLSSALATLEKRSAPSHPCSECISTWKEKGCQHCSVQISRSINAKKLRRSQSVRSSIRRSARFSSMGSHDKYETMEDSTDLPSKPPRGLTKRIPKTPVYSNMDAEWDDTPNDLNTDENSSFKVLYPYQAQRPDELVLQKGDHVLVHRKDEDGWWYGTINGKKGYFPAAYVEGTDGGQSSNA
ncbi:nostrin [Spea bombifrons]|uniref:nostrin n=1 Tax=Spea bombifrons TaxID=233779 RepID=UPI00234A5427|nr:nostrin [Spea bombifrons]